MKERLRTHRVPLISALLVGVVCMALYAPTLGYDFVNLDDDFYILNNPVVTGGLSWAAVDAAWTATPGSYWAPLLWISFMLDVEMFGLNPWGFHLVNVLLFALNAVLLSVLVWRWSGRTGVALAAALLWALHPSRVESVAWISERKDVLSGLFFLLGLGVYVEGRRGHVRHGMALAWACMLLGGLAKQILIVMPPVMVLLDIWPLGRTTWSRLWKDGWALAGEKWAFWALALLFTLAPIWVHHRDDGLLAIPLLHRFVMIPVHYLFHLWKVIWPSGLGVLLPDIPFRWSWFLGGAGGLGLVSLWLWRKREAWPWALMGWVWFVGTLLPLSGVVWAGSERIAIRFQYIPQMGLMLAVVLIADHVRRTRKWNGRWGAALCAPVLIVWAGLSLRLMPHWRDGQTIHRRALELNPGSIHAFDNLGAAYFQKGQFAEWQAYLEAFRERHPHSGLAAVHYGWWKAAMLGRPEAAIEALRGITGLDPEDIEFWTWLDGRTRDRKLLGLWRDTAAIHLRTQGNIPRMEELRALWEGAWDERTQLNYMIELFYAFWWAGREGEWGETADRLIAETPERLMVRWQGGARGYAFRLFEEIARKKPEDGRLLNNMAWILATAEPDGLEHAGMDQWPAVAIEWAERALALGGEEMPEVWNTVAAARANAGDFDGAIAAAERGLALARQTGKPSLATQLAERLAVYRDERPWRE